MEDARDAEDQRLLEAGEHSALVESYYGVMLDRCRTRLWTADEQTAVAADAAIRLLAELKRGRRYRVPFRVVVHQVVGWKIKEHFEHVKSKSNEVELEEWMHEASTDGTRPVEELIADQGFEAFVAGLTELEEQVIRLRYNDDLDFGEIAVILGKEPNAVHQTHHRALEKLRRAAA